MDLRANKQKLNKPSDKVDLKENKCIEKYLPKRENLEWHRLNVFKTG